MRIRTWFPVLCLVLLVSAGVMAGEGEGEGEDELIALAERTAARMLKNPPEGLTRAEVALAFGWMHLFGMLGRPEPERGVEYLELSLSEGLPEAGVVLGAVYLGQGGIAGGPRDVGKAMAYYEQAAEEGSVDAMRMLGVIYLEGAEGVPADAEKGMVYLRRAAERGSEAALGLLKERMAEAAAWEEANPDREADFPSSREKLVDEKLAAEARARSNRVSEVTAKVFDLLMADVSQDDAEKLSAAAARAMGREGGDIWAELEAVIDSAAKEIIESEPEASRGDAALIVGILHYMGFLQGYAPEKAKEYLERAYAMGVPEAGATLGELYLGLTRKEGERDIAKGLAYLEEAAGRDSVDALRVLGLAYAGGVEGLEADAGKSEGYFRAAARHGDAESLKRLGLAEGDAIVDGGLADAARERQAVLNRMVERLNREFEKRVVAAMDGTEGGKP